MPKPNKGEKKSDYTDRCMGDKDMNTKYPNNKQRYIVCNSLFNKGGDSKTNEEKGPPSATKNSEYVEVLAFNISGLREEMLEGKKHIVAPVIFLTEGVHRGSGGAVFYPWEELAKVPAVWNGIPIPVYHPSDDGDSISANSPEQIEKNNVGRLWHVVADEENKRLKGEIWVDIEKARKVYPPLLTMLKGNKQIEVSTGLWFDSDSKAGIWNGENFASTVRNYRPDHLAILPDEVGACSWKDGCGIRANVEENMLGHSETMDKLHAEVQKYSKTGSETPGGDRIDTNLVEVYPDHFIFRAEIRDSNTGKQKEVKLYKQNYVTDENDKVTVSGESVEVKKDVSYSEVKPSTKEVSVMREKGLIDALIKIPQMGLNEADTKYLQELDEPNFAKLVAMGEKFKGCKTCNEPVGNKESKPVTTPVVNKEIPPAPAPVVVDNTPEKPVTTEEYVTNAPKEVKEVLESGIRMHKAYKAELIDTIVGNKKNRFDSAELAEMKISDLEKLADLAESSEYVGAVGTANRAPKPDERKADGTGVPKPPTMNFEKRNRNSRQPVGSAK